MRSSLLAAAFFILLPTLAFAQGKGVDTQTQKIKEDVNKTTTRAEQSGKSFDWGKGKTRVRELLPNPYKLSARRDVLIETIQQVLKERKLVIDEASSRFSDGIVITQPYIFAKGSVVAENELHRYAVLPFGDNAWSRGRYTLTIEVQPIDGVQNNVSVNAKVEGRAGNGLISEWTTVPSSGLAEDEFLAKLVEVVTGQPVEPVVKPVDQ